MGEMQRVSVQRPAQRHTSLSAARKSSTAQRARAERHDTDGTTLQRMMAAGALQPRLTVGAADDLYEREAERTAAAVMSPGSAMKVGADGFHRTGIAAGLTRVVRRALGRMDPPTSKDDEKRKDEDKKTAVQKKRAGPDPSVVPAGVESSIEAMSASGGSPLPSSLRSNLEVRFGYDFAGVRVHTDPKAAGAASSLGARAFTVGEHVFFGAGEYQPTSRQGLHLIAHELTHVVQQGADPNRIRRRTIESWTLGDTTYFKTRSGEVIELPEDMTAEQVAKLEDDALLAEKKLAELPRPKPVPEVRKPAPKPVKTQAPKPRPRARRAGGKVLPKVADAAAALMKAVGGGAVAKYLVTRGAPVFAQGAAKLSRLRSNEQTHEDSGEKLKRSEDAVKIPASEEQSTGNAAQVGTVGDRPVPVVDDNKGKGKLTQSLDENVPHSIGELDNFKRDKKAQHTGADVMEVVQGDRDAVVKTFGTLTVTPPPVRSTHEPVDLPPPEHAPSTATINLGRDAIAPLQKEHTDVSAYTKQADSKLKEEGVTQEQLDMVDSGDLAEANKEKKGMAVQAATEPLAIQKMAQEERTKVDKELAHEEHAERGALVAQRKSALAATGSKQKDTRTALEKKREAVATEINSRYQATQDKVTKRLADLDGQSMKRFDDGNAAAAKDFEGDVNRELEAYKDDRYSGWFGWARKAKDWLLGMDKLPRVKAIFDSNRKVFEKRIGKLVEDITADNERVIRECKEELATTRKQIDEFVAGLEPGLKEIGKKAAGEMQERLNDLDKQIGKKEEELRNKLKDKQTAAIRAIDEKIEKMKESMSGALAKLGRLLLWAAKKFFTWALEKFGFSLSTIENIINKGTAVLKAIFTGPIQFVKNLISAAKTGFTNFAKNFLTHLKDAVFEWLTGALQGVTLPESWNLKGILSVLFQVIGLSWTNIKARLVLLIPAPVVESLQTTFGLVKTLIADGPMAAWEQLKDVGEDLRKGFVDAITGWIKWKVVEEAVKTVLALFVPGAGIVRAVIAIYDTIVFFIQKAKDIMEMIGNFLGSIAEIAAGNIGAAALALENGLARGLKLVISFLAKFLRLDGITARIRTALDTVRNKVNTVIDKVATWVVNMAKKAGKIGKGEKDEMKGEDPKWGIAVAGVHAEIAEAEKKEPMTTKGIDAAIPTWKRKYGFVSLRVEAAEAKWTLFGSMSPERIVEQHNVATPLELKDLQPEVDYYLPLATAKGKDDKVIDVGEFVALKVLNGEWWIVYLPSKRKRGASGAVAVMARAMKPGGKEKAYVRAGAPGTILSVLSQGTGPNGRASWVHAQPLALQGSYTAPGTVSPLGWARLGASANWVRAHLINGEMGGPAATWNLVPAPSAVNSAMTSGHENPIRRDLERGKYFFFGADVDYYNDADSKDFRRASDFARSISISYGETELVPPELKTFKDSPAGLKSKKYSVPLPVLDELDPKRRAS